LDRFSVRWQDFSLLITDTGILDIISKRDVALIYLDSTDYLGPRHQLYFHRFKDAIVRLAMSFPVLKESFDPANRLQQMFDFILKQSCAQLISKGESRWGYHRDLDSRCSTRTRHRTLVEILEDEFFKGTAKRN
jgi:hypothetical protein